jgi:hypothetical protein|tara:strand:+ start:652 stop:1272 length:621 start_codon:yes stop_codon:yes gene_type:complete
MSNFIKIKSELDNRGIFLDTVPNDIFNIIDREIKNKKIDERKNLAGHIQEEYKIENVDEKVQKYILKLPSKCSYLQEYSNRIKILDKNLPYFLSNMWVNYQKKHEFNPIHTHTGVFSFVIFNKIPYNLEDEFKVFPIVNNNVHKTSCLEFVINSSYSQMNTYTLSVDKSFVGKIVMFPAMLPHLVYPFYTSDDYRITVSGNISLKT